jgi:hypothetical protein
MSVRWVRICLLSSPVAAVSQVERRAGTPQPTCGEGSCEDECKVGEDLSLLLPCGSRVPGGEGRAHLSLPVVEAAVRMSVRCVRICLLSSPTAAVSKEERRAGTSAYLWWRQL